MTENQKVFGCVNNTIRTRSGVYFDLADPRPETIHLSDIAGALAKLCRYGGQVPQFYSVAEHLCHCGEQAIADKLQLPAVQAVFMHDAVEAYVGDMVKPLKIMLPQYAEIERRVELAIGKRFGIDFDAHADAIKKIDMEMLIAEKRAMFGEDGVKWHGEDDVRRLVRTSFLFHPPKAAEHVFKTFAVMFDIREVPQ